MPSCGSDVGDEPGTTTYSPMSPDHDGARSTTITMTGRHLPGADGRAVAGKTGSLMLVPGFGDVMMARADSSGWENGGAVRPQP